MNTYKAKILVVEDDVNLGFVLQDYLEMSGYEITLREDGQQGLEAFLQLKDEIDLCIFDIMMPYKDGFSLAEDIRKISKSMPIIFLSAKSMKQDKLRGFKIGADDYITKPFSSEELQLRIEAVLRRYKFASSIVDNSGIYEIGKFTFDLSNQILTHDNEVKKLTKREAEVLNVLCINLNKVVKRETALKSIWGENDYFKGRSMDVYITKLRKYLKDDKSVAISNIHGTGFKLEIK